jgi:methylglutaconyl-CoA hydratase
MDYEQNYADSLALAKCMYTLYSIPQPVVAVAQGAVKGGGNGLLAASDIALCLNTTKFSFSEVTLGLVPAVISPYVINKIGISRAKELMLTARVFDGKEAAAYNLVNASVDEQELPDLLNKYIGWLSANSKQAMQATKELLKKLPSLGQRDVLLDITAKTIAQARISPDGQEGMSAFLEKRKPNFKK